MPFYNLLVFKFTNFDYDSKLILQTLLIVLLWNKEVWKKTYTEFYDFLLRLEISHTGFESSYFCYEIVFPFKWTSFYINSKWPIKCRGFNEAPSHKGKISYKCPGSNEQPGLHKWALKLSTNFKRMKRRTFAINFRRKFGRKLAILWKIYLPDTFWSFYFFTFFDKYPGSIMRSVLISV